MKEIQLCRQGKNKGKYVALVDDEDFDNINSFRWWAIKDGNVFYAVRNITVDGRLTKIRMHCEIMNGRGIDHRDTNGLNNQKSNLRFCTNQENNMNSRKRENCTSVYKGVTFSKHANKWNAKITINGKLIHLGYFVSEVDAAKAYNAKAIELFGEFANLNLVN